MVVITYKLTDGKGEEVVSMATTKCNFHPYSMILAGHAASTRVSTGAICRVSRVDLLCANSTLLSGIAFLIAEIVILASTPLLLNFPPINRRI